MTPRFTFSLFARPRRSRRSALGVGVLFATLVSPLFASDASTQTPLVPPVSTAQTPDAPAVSEPTRFVLTRLDVVHVGVVRDRGDVLSIELLDGGGVSVSKLDVQFIGGSRDDVFAFKKSRTRLEDVNETLRLADWANRRQLAPQAIALLETKLAEPLSDGERRVVSAKLEELRQIEKWRASAAAQTSAAASASSSAATPRSKSPTPSSDPEIAEIERWAKELPLSAFDRFARRAQPILQKRCATAGCHDGSNPNSAFRVRPKAVGTQARLALYFNLRETFDFIDFNNPAQSPILNHPVVADADGNRVYPFGEGRWSAQDCQTFVSWVESLNDGKLGRYVHRQSRVRDASAATLRPNAVSRYDRIETPNAAANAAPDLPRPTNPNPFAGLFDAQAEETPETTRFPRPSRIALPDLAVPSVADAASEADDPNSTENVLKRGGYAPKRRYRDEYDPAIFNAAAPDASARY